MAFLSACLPPATIEPAAVATAEVARDPAAAPDQCRALLGEIDEAGRHSTRDLRWGLAGIAEDRRPGLVIGDADTLYELSLERQPVDAAELYGEAPVTCDEPVIMQRKLPDGVARPLITARPACAGTIDGERVAVASSLEIISVLGPFLGWYERAKGEAPEPTLRLQYRTLDVRDGRELDPNVWLLEPSDAMLLPDEQRGRPCGSRDLPRTTAELDGFAIRWAPEQRLLFGYACCNEIRCGYDGALPKLDADLASRLPDPDRLVHSPFGCGSIGLDGQLRTRDGVAVGRVGLDAERVVGVVFLPADHPFDVGW